MTLESLILDSQHNGPCKGGEHNSSATKEQGTEGTTVRTRTHCESGGLLVLGTDSANDHCSCLQSIVSFLARTTHGTDTTHLSWGIGMRYSSSQTRWRTARSIIIGCMRREQSDLGNVVSE